MAKIFYLLISLTVNGGEEITDYNLTISDCAVAVENGRGDYCAPVLP